MRIDGEWRQCDDDIVRPMIRGQILTADGRWQPAEFPVDTGADCTVLSAALSSALGLMPIAPQGRLGGLGGTARSVALQAEIRLQRDTGGPVLFSGQFAAVVELEALDISVLGRDITGLFAVIVDQPSGTYVCSANDTATSSRRLDRTNRGQFSHHHDLRSDGRNERVRISL